jgi:hypothetical protein
MHANNIILTGPPRSGTTLSCFLLNKLENTVALHEPMNLKMFPSPAEGVRATRQFFIEMRESLLRNGTALAKVSGDKIPDNPFTQAQGGKRQSIVQKGQVHFDKPLTPDFRLVIKQNAHFSFLLPELLPHFTCYTIIRNPVSTIASWNSIQAPVSRGNLTVLKTLHPDLYKELESIPNLLQRQVRLAHELFLRYQQNPAVQIIRYEDIVDSGGKALAVISPAAAYLDQPLESKNRNKLYSETLFEEIRMALAEFPNGAFKDYYEV